MKFKIRFNGDKLTHKKELFNKQCGRCNLCGEKMIFECWNHPMEASIDHVEPISLGGRNIFVNKKLAHSWCNSDRGVMQVEHYINNGNYEFERLRRERGKNNAIAKYMWREFEKELDKIREDELDYLFNVCGLLCDDR